MAAQVTRTGLTPMKKVAAMFARHLPGLLNYLKHRITNATSEGINSQTARIITNARALSCFENLRTRVLFFLGKPDLSPARAKSQRIMRRTSLDMILLNTQNFTFQSSSIRGSGHASSRLCGRYC
jgi:hypothetical protein